MGNIFYSTPHGANSELKQQHILFKYPTLYKPYRIFKFDAFSSTIYVGPERKAIKFKTIQDHVISTLDLEQYAVFTIDDMYYYVVSDILRDRLVTFKTKNLK